MKVFRYGYEGIELEDDELRSLYDSDDVYGFVISGENSFFTLMTLGAFKSYIAGVESSKLKFTTVLKCNSYRAFCRRIKQINKIVNRLGLLHQEFPLKGLILTSAQSGDKAVDLLYSF